MSVLVERLYPLQTPICFMKGAQPFLPLSAASGKDICAAAEFFPCFIREEHGHLILLMQQLISLRLLSVQRYILASQHPENE